MKSLLKRDSILSVIYRCISMALNFVFVAIITRIFDDEKYGLWAVLTSMVTWIDVMDVGIGNGVRNMLPALVIGKRWDEAKDTVSTAYRVLGVITVFIAAIFLVLCIWVPWDIYLGYGKKDENLYLLVGIFGGTLILNFFFSLCKSVFHALQRTNITFMMTAVSNALNLIEVIILKNNLTLLKLVICYGTNLIIVSAGASVYLYIFNMPHLRPSPGRYNRKLSKAILSIGLGFFIIQIATCVINTTDSVIIARYFGSVSVAPYTLVNKIFLLPITLSICIITPFWSAFTRAIATQSTQWMRQTIKRFKISFLGVAVLIIMLGIITPVLIMVWTGYDVSGERLLIFQMMFFAILKIWCSFYSMIANGMGCIKENMYLAIMQGIINVPLSIILAVKCSMGINGVLLGTLIVLGAGAFYLPYVVSHKIKKMVKDC